MSTTSLVVGSPVAYAITLNSLASGTYVASTAVDLSAQVPLDVLVQVTIAPGTTAGNKQAVICVQASLDGANYTSGPTSGTTTTDENNLLQVGVLPLNTAAGVQRGEWSLLRAIGFVPPYHKLVVKNDSGAAFAASGCSANYATVLGSIA